MHVSFGKYETGGRYSFSQRMHWCNQMVSLAWFLNFRLQKVERTGAWEWSYFIECLPGMVF